ncbi:MAG: DNA alkylation repair protein, partial [Bdellovibrionota bacterium]
GSRYERALASGKSQECGAIYRTYLKNAKRVNSWDLVDSSAPNVVGRHLLPLSDSQVIKTLQKLARSKNIWERRIAIVSTHSMIRAERLRPTGVIAELLLADGEDLIHKASGWMLREAGARDPSWLKAWVKRKGRDMPRTMLRYSIEHWTPAERARILRETRPVRKSHRGP